MRKARVGGLDACLAEAYVIADVGNSRHGDKARSTQAKILCNPKYSIPRVVQGVLSLKRMSNCHLDLVSSTLPQLRNIYVVSNGAGDMTDVERRLVAALEAFVARRAAEREVNTAEKAKAARKREMAVPARHLAVGKTAAGAAGQITAVPTSGRELLGGRSVKTALHFKENQAGVGVLATPTGVGERVSGEGVEYEITFEGDAGEDVDDDAVDEDDRGHDREMSGGVCDSGECGDMSYDGSDVGGGAAVAQAADPASGTRGSKRVKHNLSVNVLRTTEEFKKKRKTAADEISLFRQTNAESGDCVSTALEGIAGRNDESQLAIGELIDSIMANDRAATAGQQAEDSDATLELVNALGFGSSGSALQTSALEERVEWIENKVGTIEASLTEVPDAVQQSTDASKKVMVMLEAMSKAK
jgi:hypothetical protein